MATVMRARPLSIDSAEALGIALYLQRRKLKLSQRRIADLAELERIVVSQLERGYGGTAHFRVVLRIVNALGMDIELRPRNWSPAGADLLDPTTSVTGIGLSPDALACLRAVGISEVGQIGGASELMMRSEFSNGTELYEIVCALNRHGLSLPANRHQRVPGDREREMFRLRVVEGLTLPAIAERVGGVRSERVRQILNFYFGLTGTPPAAKRHKHIVPKDARHDR